MRWSILRRKTRYKIRKIKKITDVLFARSYYKAIFLLNLIALINLYSVAGTKALITQSIIFIVGSIVAVYIANMNYDLLKRIAIPFYITACSLVGLVSIIGININGAKRWLHFYSFTLQPTELLKLGLILAIGFYLQARVKPDTRDGRQYNLLDLIVPLTLMLIPLMLILRQPDLGTAIICMLITGSILFFIGIEKRTLMIIICSLFAVGFIGWKHLKPYQKSRIEHFLSPSIDYTDKNWQSHQSLIAVGSAGFFGSGVKNGPINQLGYLPEKNTDFALASFAEEHGFISIAFILFLMNYLIMKLFFVARKTRDRFSTVIVIGVGFWLCWQSLINTMMVFGLAPIVGIPFPIISYGGSSLLAVLIAIGIIANIENRTE